MTVRFALGIDGGGTRTRAALVDETGRVRGLGESGPGNYHDVGAEAVRHNLRETLEHAWRDAGEAARPADAAYLGLASVVSDEDHAVIRQIARQLELAPDGLIETGHDLRNALAGGLAGAPGIVLVVGTGSACFGRTRDGHTWRAGGWGSRLDDFGSSTWLGLSAMVAAIRDYDGRTPSTVLRPRVMEVLKLPQLRQLLKKVDAQGLTRREIAALACTVTDAAESGDQVAVSILHHGADELALCVQTVADHLMWNAPDMIRLTMTGGLVEGCAFYRDLIRQAVARRTPRCRITAPRFSPVLGAAIIALEHLGVTLTPEIFANLESSQRTAAEKVRNEAE